MAPTWTLPLSYLRKALPVTTSKAACRSASLKAFLNVRPSQLRQVRKAIDMAAEKAAVAQQVLQKTGQAWQRAAKADYAVRSELTEMRKTTLTDEAAMKTLEEYNDGDSSGEKSCPTQMDTVVDCGTCVRGAYEVRQRTITVEGHEISAPARGTWYQTSEAVRILYDLRQRKTRILKKVVEVWHSKSPPWIAIFLQQTTGQGEACGAGHVQEWMHSG
jgi:hypothetical protein